MRTLAGFHRILVLLFALTLPVVAAGPKEAAKKAAVRHDVLYVCDCGDSCPCTSVSVKAGKCACGKALAAHHVLKVEGDEALVCACPGSCSCKLDAQDATKCGCGKAVRRLSLADTGIYFCNCGGSCACNTLKAKPGKCKCGMALHKAD
jgi:hypothetical protein